MESMPPEPDIEIDPLAPPMRELADGIATYVEAFMSCVDSIAELRSVDFQFLGEDFVESCVVDIMAIGGDA